jgi:hypothetical protein
VTIPLGRGALTIWHSAHLPGPSRNMSSLPFFTEKEILWPKYYNILVVKKITLLKKSIKKKTPSLKLLILKRV